MNALPKVRSLRNSGDTTLQGTSPVSTTLVQGDGDESMRCCSGW